jgi:hypothetical protein
LLWPFLFLGYCNSYQVRKLSLKIYLFLSVLDKNHAVNSPKTRHKQPATTYFIALTLVKTGLKSGQDVRGTRTFIYSRFALNLFLMPSEQFTPE